jgi:hypothetical protein
MKRTQTTTFADALSHAERAKLLEIRIEQAAAEMSADAAKKTATASEQLRSKMWFCLRTSLHGFGQK